ncbi:MAG: CHAT domain-containing protein [Polaribacter sp.]
MLNRCIGILICLLISNSFFSQEHPNTSIINYIDSIKLKPYNNNSLIKAEQELLQYDTLNSAKGLGYAYHELGKLYNKNKNNQKAIEVTKKAINFKRSVKDTFEIHKSLNNLYFFHKETSEKLVVLEQIIKDKKHNKYTFRAYNNAAKIYIDKGDYYKALHYYKYVIKSYQTHHSLIGEFLKAHIGSIRIYADIYDESKMNPNQLREINYHNNQIQKYSKKISEKNLASNNNNLASIYENLGRNKEAMSHYEKALKYYSQIEDNETIGWLYNNLGVIYYKLKDNQKADQYLNKALKITEDAGIWNYVYHNKGFYLQTKNLLKKIPYYQKAIKYLLENDYQYTSLDALPSITAIKESNFAIEILEDLIQIANTWVLTYNKDKEISNLQNAKKTIDLIDELISYIRFESSIDQSKLFWIHKGVDTYMLGVKVSYLLNDAKSALYFMEKNKALLLLENLNDTHTEELTITTLNSIQKNHVSKTSNFIEYILNKDEGYGIFCSDTTIEFFKINTIHQLLEQVEILKNQCSKPFAKKEDDVAYTKNADSIFQKLFPFKDALQKISGKKLTIVSDYTIKNIPFEALTVTDNAATIQKDFLIHQTEISYLYSASVLAQVQKKEHHPTEVALGVAPEIFAIDSLVPLHTSTQDIQQIASLYPTTVLKKEKATKEAVLSAINNYKIIHFNTHAGIDELTNEPWLAFYDQKIGLQELYNQPIQADLVILDACKSATGKLEIGEGVMSLSRSFTYNGAKSVIASQWNVHEKALSTIFKTFYKELQKGTSKSKALHQAKLNYLNTHQLSEISPYYWASMTLTGDTESVIIEQNSYKWVVFFLVAIGVLGLLYFRYFKK